MGQRVNIQSKLKLQSGGLENTSLTRAWSFVYLTRNRVI